MKENPRFPGGLWSFKWWRRRESNPGPALAAERGRERLSTVSAAVPGTSGRTPSELSTVEDGPGRFDCSNVANVVAAAVDALERGDVDAALLLLRPLKRHD